MTALLELPPRDDLTLTGEEIARMSGAGTKQLQIEWLQSNCWKYQLNRAGWPVVGRLYANLKLSGVEVSDMLTPEMWSPDFAKLNG